MPQSLENRFRPGEKVPVKIKGAQVMGTYVAPHTKLAGYHAIKYGGQTFYRQIKMGPVAAVISDDGVTPTEITARVRTFDINTRFMFLEKMVDMVLAGPSVSLIICGDGGLGKSFIVKQRLAAHCFKPEQDFTMIKGTATPKAIYRTLHDHRDQVVWFDDCDGSLNNPDAINVFKAALETDPAETRRISWLTERFDSDLPSSFIFTGKVVMISNRPMLGVPQPLLSRSLHVDVSMTADEKIQRITSIAPNIRADIPMPVKTEVIQLMNRFRHMTGDLNVRTFLKVLDIRCSNPDIWEQMGEYTLTSSRRDDQ
jgi:hypothetical protein